MAAEAQAQALAAAKAAEATAALEAQRAQMEQQMAEQAAALQRQQSALDKQAAAVQKEQAQAAEATRKAAEQEASLAAAALRSTNAAASAAAAAAAPMSGGSAGPGHQAGGFATTWSTEWIHNGTLDGSGLVATDTSKMYGSGMWVCGAAPLPPTGAHYVEVGFGGKPTRHCDMAIGVWGGKEPPDKSGNAYACVTKFGVPFWGLRGDKDSDALRVQGKGKGKVGRDSNGYAISGGDRIGMLADMDGCSLTFFRNGEPIERAVVQGFPKGDDMRIAATTVGSEATITLAFPANPQ
jgi:hypothetical protein